MTDSLDIMLRILLGADTVRNFENGTTSIEDALKGVDQEALDLADTFANALDSSLKELDKRFANTKKSIDGMKQSADKIGQISQTMFVAGSAIVGGMYLAAKTEADRVVEAGGQVDGVTARWLAANERIEASQQKIGRAAEVAIIPLMEQAASLAEKASDFVEKNPDLVSAALKIGVVMASIGALGSVAVKGIKLFADAKYLLATAQLTIDAAAMNTAAATMFEAAMLMQTGGSAKLGYGVSGGLIGPATTAAAPVATGGAAITAGSAALLIAAPIVGANIAKYVGNAFQRSMGQEESSWKDIGDTAKQAVMLPSKLALLGLVNLGVVSDGTGQKVSAFQNEIFGLGDAADQSASETQAAADALATLGSVAEDEAAAIKLMEGLTQENAKAERKFAADRADIFTDEARAMADANRKLEGNLSDISSALGSNIRKINSNLRTTLSDISQTLKTSLAELGENFASENIKAEREYQQQRSEIVSSGADEIKKIHEQKEKDLADAEREHIKNTRSLIADRDALGLVEENNAYAEKQAEIKRNADESIAQARANTQAQLAEAAQNYAAQRSQRLEEYQKQKADALAKAATDKADALAKAAAEKAEAQATAAEAKRNAIKDAAEEKAEIARKRAEQLTDLKKSYDRERNERVTAVYNEIKELKGALNAEMLMRRTYQNQILADTTAHMQAMAKVQTGSVPVRSHTVTTNNGFNGATSGAGGSPTHDYSGYAYSGLYAMAQDGQREYVLSGAATKAAEQMVGGQLNQQALLSGLAGQKASGMQYVDNASYSGVTVADMRRIRQQSRQEAISVMNQVYNNRK